MTERHTCTQCRQNWQPGKRDHEGAWLCDGCYEKFMANLLRMLAELP